MDIPTATDIPGTHLVSNIRVSGLRHIKTFAGCLQCHSPLADGEKRCTPCGSDTFGVHASVVGRFEDDEGRHFRAFFDSTVLSKFLGIPLGKDFDEKVRGDMEFKFLDAIVDQSFNLIVSEQYSKTRKATEAPLFVVDAVVGQDICCSNTPEPPLQTSKRTRRGQGQ